RGRRRGGRPRLPRGRSVRRAARHVRRPPRDARRHRAEPLRGDPAGVEVAGDVDQPDPPRRARRRRRLPRRGRAAPGGSPPLGAHAEIPKAPAEIRRGPSSLLQPPAQELVALLGRAEPREADPGPDTVLLLDETAGGEADRLDECVGGADRDDLEDPPFAPRVEVDPELPGLDPVVVPASGAGHSEAQAFAALRRSAAKACASEICFRGTSTAKAAVSVSTVRNFSPPDSFAATAPRPIPAKSPTGPKRSPPTIAPPPVRPRVARRRNSEPSSTRTSRTSSRSAEPFFPVPV